MFVIIIVAFNFDPEYDAVNFECHNSHYYFIKSLQTDIIAFFILFFRLGVIVGSCCSACGYISSIM